MSLIQNKFLKAAENGDLKTVDKLLNKNRVSQDIISLYAFHWACRNGHIEVVKRLMADPLFSPERKSTFDSFLFACRNGHIKVVQHLLNDVDPTTDNNLAIIWAGDFGHHDIVLLLMADKRVNPSGEDFVRIYTSPGVYFDIINFGDGTILKVKNGYFEMIKDDNIREKYLKWLYRIGGEKYLEARCSFETSL